MQTGQGCCRQGRADADQGKADADQGRDKTGLLQRRDGASRVGASDNTLF